MDILHIVPEFKWSRIFIFPIACKQEEIGHRVWISAPNVDPEVDVINNVKFVSWNKKYKDVLNYFFSLFLMVKMVRKNKINKIYFHTTVDSTLNIIALKMFSSAELVYVNHGVPYLGYTSIFKNILMLCEIININFTHKSITITKSMKNLLKPLNYSGKELIPLVPGTLVGVKIPYQNFEELKATRNSFILNSQNNDTWKILYVGRLEHRKGIYDLIEAVNKTKLNCELVVLGGAANELESNLDLSKVKFFGFQTDLAPYYLTADLLCVPSHHEGFGQVYLEAAAHGVIPICCNIPGPTDFIQHNVNGFLVEAKSPDSIMNLLEQINQNIFDLELLQKRAFETVQIYETSHIITKNMENF